MYFLGRAALHRPTTDGRLPLPTDVLPPVWDFVAVCAGIPVLAGLLTVAQLRHVTLSPMGVFRRAPRTRAPRPWPGLLTLVGVGLLLAVGPYIGWKTQQGETYSRGLVGFLVIGGAVLSSVGVIVSAGWFSYHTGRLLGRVARRPATLIAARRLTSDPWAGSRTFAALLACLVFAGGAVGYRAFLTTLVGHRAERDRSWAEATGRDFPPGPDDDFYLRTMDLVDLAVQVAAVIAALGLLITIAEGVLSRRRANTSLVATGVPRATLARSLVWQVLTPAVPATLVAVVVGATAARGLADERVVSPAVSTCTGDREACADPASAAASQTVVELPWVSHIVPVPVTGLALTWGIAGLAVLLVIGLGLLTLRNSTAIEELRTT